MNPIHQGAAFIGVTVLLLLLWSMRQPGRRQIIEEAIRAYHLPLKNALLAELASQGFKRAMLDIQSAWFYYNDSHGKKDDDVLTIGPTIKNAVPCECQESPNCGTCHGSGFIPRSYRDLMKSEPLSLPWLRSYARKHGIDTTMRHVASLSDLFEESPMCPSIGPAQYQLTECNCAANPDSWDCPYCGDTKQVTLANKELQNGTLPQDKPLMALAIPKPEHDRSEPISGTLHGINTQNGNPHLWSFGLQTGKLECGQFFFSEFTLHILGADPSAKLLNGTFAKET